MRSSLVTDLPLKPQPAFVVDLGTLASFSLHFPDVNQLARLSSDWVVTKRQGASQQGLRPLEL